MTKANFNDPRTTPPPRGGALGPTLAKFAVGLVMGVALGAGLVYLVALKLQPAPTASASCEENLESLANSIYVGYKQSRPDSLDDLRASGVPAATFLCPTAGSVHGDAGGGLPTDYIYAPGLGENDALPPPLLFELPANHGQEFCHIMQRDPGKATTIKDISQLYGRVQGLNDYLVGHRGGAAGGSK